MSGGFSFGQGANPPQTVSFSGFQTATTTPSGGFSFGNIASAAQRPTGSGFAFGSAGGTLFGGSGTTATTAASTGLFVAPAATSTVAPSSTGGFPFGAPTVTTQALNSGFTFGGSTAPSVTTAPAQRPTMPTAAGGFSFGPAVTQAAAGGTSVFGSVAPTAPAGGLFGAGAAAPSFGQQAQSQPSTTSASTGSGFTLGGGGGSRLFGQTAGAGFVAPATATAVPQPSTPGSLFGTSVSTKSQNASTGLGATRPAAPAPLLGGSTTSSTLFGQNLGTPTAATGLFGTAPAGPHTGAVTTSGILGTPSQATAYQPTGGTTVGTNIFARAITAAGASSSTTANAIATQATPGAATGGFPLSKSLTAPAGVTTTGGVAGGIAAPTAAAGGTPGGFGFSTPTTNTLSVPQAQGGTATASAAGIPSVAAGVPQTTVASVAFGATNTLRPASGPGTAIHPTVGSLFTQPGQATSVTGVSQPAAMPGFAGIGTPARPPLSTGLTGQLAVTSLFPATTTAPAQATASAQPASTSGATAIGGLPSFNFGKSVSGPSAVTTSQPNQASATAAATLGGPVASTVGGAAPSIGAIGTTVTPATLGLSTGINASTTPGLFTAPGLSKSLTDTALSISLPSTVTTTTAAAPSGGFGLTVPTGAPAMVAPPVPTTSAAVDSAAIPSTLTYGQLEDLINKWRTELEDLERVFLNQATQVNAWDRVLVENNEKIVHLYQVLDTVTTDHRSVDQDLDVVQSQQDELDGVILQLEKQMETQMKGLAVSASYGGYGPHSDAQRKNLMDLTVKVDSQMKQMGLDLNSLVDSINSVTDHNASNNQDDTLRQICKILEKQMDTLQWVDRTTAQLQERVSDISTQLQDRR